MVLGAYKHTANLISAPYSMELLDWLLVFGIAIASIVGTLLVIPASRMATPTIVNMVRSTELLFAYAVEFALYGMVPKPLVAVGSALVLASITAMTLADKIQEKLDKLFRPSSTSLEKGESDGEQSDGAVRSSLLVCETYTTDLNETTGPRFRDSAYETMSDISQLRAPSCAQKDCIQGA